MSLPNNQNVSTNSDNIKATHVYFAPVSTTSMKRSGGHEIGDDSSCKKLRYDVSPSTSSWNLGSSVNTASNKNNINIASQYLKKERSFSLSVSCDSSEENAKLVTLNSTASPNDEVIVIRNFDSSDYTEITPTSPLQTSNLNDEYVLFASDVMDYVENNDCLASNIKTTLSKDTAKTTTVNLDSYTSPPVNVSCPSSISSKDTRVSTTASVEVKHLKGNKSTEIETADNIELVLLPTLQDSKLTMTKAETLTKSSIPRITTVPSNNLLRNHTGTLAASNQSKTNVFNRVSIHTALKNQPVVVSTKKLMSEVTQTTAKVSIGNTTISVPLLKPLNPTQRIQQGGIIGETQKTVQSSMQQQAQLSLSKILNVKRGQKMNQPTIVSLSQLQIKPVTTAKIVQAKVVSKKMPMSHVPISLTSVPQSTNSVATITTHTLAENVESTEDTSANTVGTSSNLSKLYTETKLTPSMDEQAKVQNIDDKSGSVVIKKSASHNTASDVPPLVATLSKSVNQQGNISHQLATSICSTVSIIRQNSSPSTTLAPGTNASNPIITSDTKMQTDIHNIKSAVTINSTNKLSSNPLITIPRNISLMLTKTSASQPTKTVTNVSNTFNIPTQIVTSIASDQLKKISLPKASTVNIVAVSSASTNTGLAQSLESIPKQEFLSVSMQSYENMGNSDQASNNHKTLKLQSNSTSLGHHTIKRSKSSDEADKDTNVISQVPNTTKRRSIEVLAPKRCSGVEENPTNTSTSDQQVDGLYEKSIKAKNNFSSPMPIASNSVISKSEETNNVLLKQLLQNSSTPHNSNQILTSSNCGQNSVCNQVISTRKVINVRAPSLGLVSSLEAQLARPVIPPVPANSSTPIHLQVKQVKNSKENTSQTTEYEIIPPQIDSKSKPSVQIISKETSFVSKPVASMNSSDHGRTKSCDPVVDLVPTESTSTTYNATSKLMDLKVSPKSIPISDQKKRSSVEIKTEVPDGSIQINKMASSTGVVNDAPGNTSILHTNTTFANNANNDDEQGFHFKNLLKSDSKMKNSSLENVCAKLNLPPTTHNVSTLNVPFKVGSTTAAEEKNFTSSSLVIFDVRQSPEKLDTNTDPSKQQDVLIQNRPADNLELKEQSVTPILKDGLPPIDSTGLKSQNVDKSSCLNKVADMRKKRKREYQKHRRQLLNSSNTVAANSICNASNMRKRPRKISKMEEDYDSFIDNLILNIRQMQPLQVLEPLLNRTLNICNIHGRRNSMRSNYNKKNDDALQQFLLGEYGFGFHPNLSMHYDISNLRSPISKENLTSIQNNFYDQEFLPVLYRSEQYTLSRCVPNMRERNIEVIDVIKNGNSTGSCDQEKNIKWNTLSRIPYPGLVLMNNLTNHCLGRMSPVIPFVDRFPLKIKHVIRPLKPIFNCEMKTLLSNDDVKKQTDMTQHKNSETNLNSKTVVLSLPSSAANNIMGVLKDLANLLHIPTPVTYKIVKSLEPIVDRSSDKNEPISHKPPLQYTNLQQILSGRRRMCRNCGLPINSIGIRISKNMFAATSCCQNENKSLPSYFYFCGRTCYAQFKRLHRNQSSIGTHTSQLSSELSKKRDANEGLSENKGANNGDKERKLGLKYYNSKSFSPTPQPRQPSEKELTDILFKMGITLSVSNMDFEMSSGKVIRNIEDTRQCIFCNERGDGLSDGPSRLLNFDIDKWVHLNCALWSSDVYETISGGLMNFSVALQAGLNQSCNVCHQVGATLKCFKPRCGAIFHLPCAIKEKCVFYKNKTIHCQQHASRLDKENELQSLSVHRRVYVERDENYQVAAVMHHSELNNLLRIGSLTFLNIGQLLPHQLDAFHTSNYIYPVGYKVIRFYWSMRRPHKRCRYICTIGESAGRPEFVVQVQEPMESDIEFRDSSPKAVWQRILEPISALRKDCNLVQHFPQFITGEDLFGLTEPAIVRILESLPGVDTLTNYRFKYGRNPLLELPLAINPSGAARTEPKQRQLLGWRKPHTQRTSNNSNQRLVNSTSSVIAGEVACPYSKQFVHSKSSQYKKMKQEWRNNVYLARSKIQGLGLYSARDMEKHTMIIEYIGEVIRTEVSEIREKQYEARNRGIYMFRLDEERVVDATLSGGLARYINHSCNPNCVTEIVEVDREVRIIIFAKRRITRGEELSYDYKFDIEDDAHKISCMCGAPNCRKWMN